MPIPPVLIQRNPEICAAELDGEICLFHPDTAQYLNLNATGSAIWRLLETPTHRDDLVARLLARFVVEEALCRQETEAFLREALALGMLHEDPAPA
ncbi:MAG: PqqD family protein [Cyanobacteriota bacterium]|nr:PqqD family protein [Cyanobacteriota bacterium]